MRSRSLIRLLPLLLLALGGAREAAAQACLSTQGSNEYCKALTPAVRFGFPRYATAALPTCNTSNKGAVAFDTTAGSYKGCDGSTWAAIGFSGGTITSPILAPAADNCASVPYSFTGETGTGVCLSATNTMIFSIGGYKYYAVRGDTFQIGQGASLSFTAAAPTASTGDLFLYRDAANALALRNGTNAQTFNWYYSYTDASNYHRGALKTSASGIEIAAETAGSGADNLDVTITPAGTGSLLTGSALSLTKESGITMSGAVMRLYGGNTLQWLLDGQGLYPNVTAAFDLGLAVRQVRSMYLTESIQGSKTKALSESSATTFVTVAVPQTAGSNYAAGRVGYTVYASDGTDSQTLHGVAQFSAVNKAGTETCAAIADVQTAVAESAGGSTLTCTITCVTGLTDVVGLAANCASSLTQTTLTIQARLDLEQPNTLVFP